MRKKIGNYAKVIFFTLSRWCCCCYRDVMVPFAVVTDIAVSHRQNKFTRHCRINVFVCVLPSLSVAVLDTERLPCHMYVSMYVSPFLPDVWVCHVACHPCNISQWAMLNARHVYTRPTEYEWTNFPCLSSLLTVGCVHTQHIFYFHCSMLSDIIPYFLPFVIRINNDRNKRWVGGWASVFAFVLFGIYCRDRFIECLLRTLFFHLLTSFDFITQCVYAEKMRW